MRSVTVDRNIRAVAQTVLAARSAGEDGIVVNDYEFDFSWRARCQQCAREVFSATTGQPMPHAGSCAEDTFQGLFGDPDIPRIDGRNVRQGGVYHYFKYGTVGHVIEEYAPGEYIQSTSRDDLGVCGDAPTQDQWNRWEASFVMLPTAPPTGYEPGDIKVCFRVGTSVVSVPGYMTSHCVIGANALSGLLFDALAIDLMHEHRAVAIGHFNPAMLPAPLANYQGYAVGPMMVVCNDVQIPAWFTDHAVVGLRAAVEALGCSVNYDPATRTATIMQPGQGG